MGMLSAMAPLQARGEHCSIQVWEVILYIVHLLVVPQFHFISSPPYT